MDFHTTNYLYMMAVNTVTIATAVLQPEKATLDVGDVIIRFLWYTCEIPVYVFKQAIVWGF